ncbi:MAG TPA: NUDIX domain-containing protein [Candidatus Binataceae bacterium]|nr:NUDIX domain-containing protein [Candidatus Binataceae bacterium]
MLTNSGATEVSGFPNHSGRIAARRHARPKVAVDIVLFAIDDGQVTCYLVRLRWGPLSGKWAFPGGLVREGEMLDDAARRELHQSAGLSDCYIEQLFSFGDPHRDPKSHVVSVAYMALIDRVSAVHSCSKKYANGEWFDVKALPQLAYDHTEIAEYAVRRLKAKLEYTNIACNLLPPAFTFAQLEELYGIVLGRALDRRNFRRRIMSMNLLNRSPMKRRGKHRPATLYSFQQRSLQVIEML